MSDSQRARSDPSGAWDRARGAYLAVLGAEDPAATLLADGAVDRRLGGSELVTDGRTILVSGPDDLRELRDIVEDALGVGTWPRGPAVDVASVESGAITTRIDVERPAALLGLLIAMEGLIEARSPWGKWRTVVDTMAARVADLDALTVDIRVVEPTV